jgi:glycosyltransferase involved in cell wall biosynthesis
VEVTPALIRKLPSLSMNILHLYKAALPHSMGGVEQVIHQLAKGAVEKGANVEVLALNRGPRDVVDGGGYKVYYQPTLFEVASTPFSLKAFYKFRELSKKADIIHYHYPYPFADLLHLGCCPRKPSIVTYHSDIVRQRKLLKLYKPLQKRFLSSMDRIVATSPNYVQTSETLQDYVDKVSVIPLGLEESSYPEPSIERLDHWKKRVGSKFFLFIGVLRYYKGLHILLDALKEADYPTVIIGTGPEENTLKQKANEYGLKNIHFLGHVSDEDKAALLKLCYAFVFPSHLRSEAFGLSLVEAAMFGKPMISCEIGTGTSYINIHGETGYVVKPNDSVELAQCMLMLWKDEIKIGQFGKSARKRYILAFKSSIMTKNYMDLYRMVV